MSNGEQVKPGRRFWNSRVEIFLYSALAVACLYMAYATKRNHMLWSRLASTESALKEELNKNAACLQWADDINRTSQRAKASEQSAAVDGAAQEIAEVAPVDLDELPYEIARGGRPKKKCKKTVGGDGVSSISCSCSTGEGDIDPVRQTAIDEEIARANQTLTARVRLAAAIAAAERGKSPPYIPELGVSQLSDEDAGAVPAHAQNEPEPESVGLTPDPPPQEGAIATAPYEYRPDDL